MLLIGLSIVVRTPYYYLGVVWAVGTKPRLLILITVVESEVVGPPFGLIINIADLSFVRPV